MKVYSIITGKARIEFSVWKVGASYEARVNGMVIYKSDSFSACSEAINETFETNVFSVSGAVH